ncbi:MAG TPA: hypothetical protein VL025_22515 [Thermoanaerobaculia bacterium]|nr:hypothetical protein [Thermoanaerobaculia bacterium]
MSGRTFRRTIVLALALSAGLVSASNAHAARVRADREPAIRQEASIRTLAGNAWDLVQGLFVKNHITPGSNPPQPEGPGLCPLGKPGRTGQPGKGN